MADQLESSWNRTGMALGHWFATTVVVDVMLRRCPEQMHASQATLSSHFATLCSPRESRRIVLLYRRYPDKAINSDVVAAGLVGACCLMHVLHARQRAIILSLNWKGMAGVITNCWKAWYLNSWGGVESGEFDYQEFRLTFGWIFTYYF